MTIKINKIALLFSLLAMVSCYFLGIKAMAKNNYNLETKTSNLQVFEQSILLPVSAPPKAEVKNTLNVIVTAYSSTECQTDDTPFITASNSLVRDGIVANNLLPFGTKVRMPELFGDKVFEVDDRMHQRKGNFHVDVWFPTTEEAKQFGVKFASLEVLVD
ncbi:3D domain-containing protein [Candidatus Gribaldobacteria bacterium]|nr:3D domain-containing protein [Candidatus Gribaldobacteria bacterium]